MAKTKSKKLPAFQFYPGDWLRDPGLRGCSPAARGVWIDMLCLMHSTEQRGVLRSNGRAWDVEKIARTIAGATPENVQELIDEGVASVGERTGTIYSKRMVRDELIRRRKAASGSKGGSKSRPPAKQNPSKTQANPEAKSGSSSSSSSSVSTSVNCKTEDSMSAKADVSAAAGEKIPFDEIVKNWNATIEGTGLVAVKSLTDARRAKLRARWSEQLFRENWAKIFEQAAQSEFFRSGAQRWARFDWLIKNNANYVKVLEGNYVDGNDNDEYNF